MMNRKKSVLWLLFFLLFCTLEIEAKRSFSIRTRSKSTGTQYNSRRKSHRDGGTDGVVGPGGAVGSSVNTGTSNSQVSNSHIVPSGTNSHSVGSSVHSDHSLSNTGRLEREASVGKLTGSGINSKANGPEIGAPNQRPIGWDINNNHNNKPPVGPPPPYPGLGGSSKTYNQHPPSYYQSMGNPPTYVASQAHYGVGNTYGYPNTGTHGQGVPSGAGYSGVNGLSSPTLNGAGYTGYTGASMAGGLSNQYPNNHGGIGAGGFNNGNGMGGYGSNYGYQKPGLFSTGNILTGLVTWQVARALTPSRHHSHVHNNYYTNNGTQPVVTDPNQTPIPHIATPVKPETQIPAESIKVPVPVH